MKFGDCVPQNPKMGSVMYRVHHFIPLNGETLTITFCLEVFQYAE